MRIYCTKCNHQQEYLERHCEECGTRYGGKLWVLIAGASLIMGLPITILTSSSYQLSELISPIYVFGYVLPVLIGMAFLYDYHPNRRGLYFYGGTAVIIIGLITFGF